MQIAIVGAGMAGLSCATRLAALGHELVLFDKGRGPGGRMATRRVEADGTMLRFDHGSYLNPQALSEALLHLVHEQCLPVCPISCVRSA